MRWSFVTSVRKSGHGRVTRVSQNGRNNECEKPSTFNDTVVASLSLAALKVSLMAEDENLAASQDAAVRQP